MESAYEDYQAGRQKNSKNAQDTFDGHGVGSGGHRKRKSAANTGKCGGRTDRTALGARLGEDASGRHTLPVSLPQVCSPLKKPPGLSNKLEPLVDCYQRISTKSF